MTPKGSENHCVRELGSRYAQAAQMIAALEAAIKVGQTEYELLQERVAYLEAELLKCREHQTNIL
jgi:uncharacterized coiled-coil protein SlyX